MTFRTHLKDMLIPYIDGLCVLDLHPGQDRLEPVAHVESLNIVKLYEIQLRCTFKYAKKEQEHPQKPKETPLTPSYPKGIYGLPNISHNSSISPGHLD